MRAAHVLRPLDPVAAGLAGLLDQIEGVQCWIKDREGRYCWVNRGFLEDSPVNGTSATVFRPMSDS